MVVNGDCIVHYILINSSTKTKACFPPKALFSSENFWEMDTVAFSFVFDKYYLIMD